MTQAGQIFLSYSRADSEFALKLGGDLRKAGIDVWIDQFDIPPSVPWDEEIQKGLDESKGLLVILSRSSVESDNVLNEINYALETKKQVWPIIMEAGIKKPFNINRLQHIDFSNSYEEGFSLLLKSVKPGTRPALAAQVEVYKSPIKYIVAIVIAVIILLAFLTFRGTLFSKGDNAEFEAHPAFSAKLANGKWTSDTLTNQFDPADKYQIIFNLNIQDTLVTGDIDLVATREGKGYHVKRQFREGRIIGRNLSFYTLEESFEGGQTIYFKNFYKGLVSKDSVNFVWSSDRPWDFPEQRFSARK